MPPFGQARPPMRMRKLSWFLYLSTVLLGLGLHQRNRGHPHCIRSLLSSLPGRSLTFAAADHSYFHVAFLCKSKHCLFIHASVDASFGGFQVFLWWSQPCEYSWAHLIVYISFYICWVNSQKPAGMVGMSSVVIFAYMIYLPTAVPHLYVCVCVLSRFSHVWLLVTPWTVAHQTALSMGFSKQEYWSGLPCPPSGCPISNSTLTAESREELKSLLMKMKEESEKTGLKFSIQKTTIMASGPITSWHTEEEKWKQ